MSGPGLVHWSCSSSFVSYQDWSDQIFLSQPLYWCRSVSRCKSSMNAGYGVLFLAQGLTTQLGTDMSSSIEDIWMLERLRIADGFLDLWFLIKDLIMSFDIFYPKISLVVSFLDRVNTPCNPTSSDQWSAGSLSLLHKHIYLEMLMCVCMKRTFLGVSVDWGKQTLVPQNFEKSCLFFLAWFELT